MLNLLFVCVTSMTLHFFTFWCLCRHTQWWQKRNGRLARTWDRTFRDFRNLISRFRLQFSGFGRRVARERPNEISSPGLLSGSNFGPNLQKQIRISRKLSWTKWMTIWANYWNWNVNFFIFLMRNASHSNVIHTNFKSIIKTTTELIKKPQKYKIRKKYIVL